MNDTARDLMRALAALLAAGILLGACGSDPKQATSKTTQSAEVEADALAQQVCGKVSGTESLNAVADEAIALATRAARLSPRWQALYESIDLLVNHMHQLPEPKVIEADRMAGIDQLFGWAQENRPLKEAVTRECRKAVL